jgi:chaperonin cofactor prefoldin
MATRSEKAVDAGDTLSEIRKRVEHNEMRAREFESQARIIEARLRLFDAQKKIRDHLSAAEAPSPK